MFIHGVSLVFQHVKEQVRVKWVGWVTETVGTVKSSHTEAKKKNVHQQTHFILLKDFCALVFDDQQTGTSSY